MLTQKGRFEGSKTVRGIEYFSLADALRHFREEIEKGMGTKVQEADVNAALLLSDICRWLGLSEEKRREVLGKSASAWVASLETESIKLQTKH